MKTKKLFLIFYCFCSICFCTQAFPLDLHDSGFNNFYTTNEFDFRVIPNELLNSRAPKFVILAGDSNVFGDGLTDHETLPAMMSKELPNFYIYNFGIRGGGPHDTLFLLQTKNYQHFITQSQGIFLYNFYPYLFERVIGAKNYLKWSRKKSPYYELNANGLLEYRGSFDDRKWITKIYRFIIRHPWIDKMLPIFPQIHSWHIRLTAVIFSEMKKKFLNDFPHSKFIVVLNNSYSQEPWHIWQNQQLAKFLKEYNVDFIETERVEGFSDKYIFSDGHINPAGIKIQSQILTKILRR